MNLTANYWKCLENRFIRKYWLQLRLEILIRVATGVALWLRVCKFHFSGQLLYFYPLSWGKNTLTKPFRGTTFYKWSFSNQAHSFGSSRWSLKDLSEAASSGNSRTWYDTSSTARWAASTCDNSSNESSKIRFICRTRASVKSETSWWRCSRCTTTRRPSWGRLAGTLTRSRFYL